MKYRLTAVSMLAVGSTTAGCSSISELPTFAPTGVETAYSITGVLKRENTCIQIDASPSVYTVVWPVGTTIDRIDPAIVRLPDQTILRVGQRVTLRGGEIDSDAYGQRARYCGSRAFQTYGLGEAR